jgi:hypothetical protein
VLTAGGDGWTREILAREPAEVRRELDVALDALFERVERRA